MIHFSWFSMTELNHIIAPFARIKRKSTPHDDESNRGNIRRHHLSPQIRCRELHYIFSMEIAIIRMPNQASCDILPCLVSIAPLFGLTIQV
jgi:hypothetical protein